MAAPPTDQIVLQKQEGKKESLESADEDSEDGEDGEDGEDEIEPLSPTSPTGLQFDDAQGQEVREKSHFWTAFKKHVNFQNLKMMGLLCSVVIYFGVVAAVFYSLEKWSVGHSLYFATVMVTTVGYGDFLPTSDHAKIATIICVLFGLSIVVQAFNVFQDICVSIAMAKGQAASKKSGYYQKTGLFAKAEQKALRGAQKASQQLRIYRKALFVTFLDIGFIAMGTFFFAWEFNKMEDSECGNCLLDGLYLSVITITTVGFGDLAPVSSGGHVFGCFFMLVGIPIQVTAFSMISNAVYPAIKDKLVIRKIRGTLTAEKFASINEFVEDMRQKQGLGNYQDQGGVVNVALSKQGREQISRFEFLAFMLVQNGAVSIKNLQTCMKNFEKIDVSNTGFISKEDVGLHTGYHHHPQMHQVAVAGAAVVGAAVDGAAAAEAAVVAEAAKVEAAVVAEAAVVGAAVAGAAVKKQGEQATEWI